MDKIPAWMKVQEILLKSKNEFILEAIDSLHKEIEEKRIEVKGGAIKLPDKSSEVETDMVIISNLLEQEPSIKERYENFIDSKKDTDDPQLILQIESLRKFLMAVDEIKILINFAKVIDEWITDPSNAMKLNDASKILSESAKKNVQRIEILEFIVNNKRFNKNEPLDKGELIIAKNAYKLLG
ncbi:MAG: hypothetical protein ACP5M9_02875 [Candidatus Micrarchaeia archaeon]